MGLLLAALILVAYLFLNKPKRGNKKEKWTDDYMNNSGNKIAKSTKRKTSTAPTTQRAFRAFEVRGIQHEGREELMYQIVEQYGLEGDTNIIFEIEPSNPYDPHAIKIIFDGIGHIGYVPKERNQEIIKHLYRDDLYLKWFIDYQGYEEYVRTLIGGKYIMEIKLYKR